ncbi:hypothetical protein ACRAWD_04255 [Caulobacter segnis]
MQANAHQDLPFERSAGGAVPLSRDLSRQPLIQATFVLQNTPATAMALDGAAAVGDVGRACDVEISICRWACGRRRRGFRGRSNTPPICSIGRRWSGSPACHLQRVLEAVTADPEQKRVSALDLLGPQERALVLSGWNAPLDAMAAPALTSQETLHARLARQGGVAAGATAVVCEGQALELLGALGGAGPVLEPAHASAGAGRGARCGGGAFTGRALAGHGGGAFGDL